MVTAYSGRIPAEEILRLDDPSTGLEGVLVIHSTNLGPAIGGCRFVPRSNSATLMADALRLAEAASYKNALAGLPFGGAQAIIMEPAGDVDRAAVSRSFAAAAARLQGRYIPLPDIGKQRCDIPAAAGTTPTSPPHHTAQGVFEAVRAAASFALEADLRGLRVAVQGVGAVGSPLCALLADAGADLLIADADERRAALAAQGHNAQHLSMADIIAADADILVPCARSDRSGGGFFHPQNLASVKARVVCGPSSHQLAAPHIAEALFDRGIIYVPDYAINAGANIAMTADIRGEKAASTRHRIAQIGPRVAHILNEARQQHIAPILIAMQMAERTMAQAERCAA